MIREEPSQSTLTKQYPIDSIIQMDKIWIPCSGTIQVLSPTKTLWKGSAWSTMEFKIKVQSKFLQLLKASTCRSHHDPNQNTVGVLSNKHLFHLRASWIPNTRKDFFPTEEPMKPSMVHPESMIQMYFDDSIHTCDFRNTLTANYSFSSDAEEPFHCTKLHVKIHQDSIHIGHQYRVIVELMPEVQTLDHSDNFNVIFFGASHVLTVTDLILNMDYELNKRFLTNSFPSISKKSTVLDIFIKVKDSQGATFIEKAQCSRKVQIDFLDKFGYSIKDLHVVDDSMNALFFPIKNVETSSSNKYTFRLKYPKPGKICPGLDFKILATMPSEYGENQEPVHPAVSNDFVSFDRIKDSHTDDQKRTAISYHRNKEKECSIRIPLHAITDAYRPKGICYGCKRSIATSIFLHAKEHEKTCPVLDVVHILSSSNCAMIQNKALSMMNVATTPSLSRSVTSQNQKRTKKDKMIPEKSSAIKRSARLPKHFTPAQKYLTKKMIAKNTKNTASRKVKAVGISRMKGNYMSMMDPLFDHSLSFQDVICPETEHDEKYQDVAAFMIRTSDLPQSLNHPKNDDSDQEKRFVESRDEDLLLNISNETNYHPDGLETTMEEPSSTD